MFQELDCLLVELDFGGLWAFILTVELRRKEVLAFKFFKFLKF
jgi:hypothetical protein